MDPFIIPHQLKESRLAKLTPALNREVTDGFLIGNRSTIWLGGVVSPWRFLFFLIFLILLFSLLSGRLIYLQIIKGDYFRQLAEDNRLRLEYLPAPRGIIFDQFEKPLIENEPTFNLIVYPAEVKEEERIEALAVISKLGIAVEGNLEEISQPASFFPLVLNEELSYEQAMLLMIELQNFSGFKIEIGSQRHYLLDNAFAHLLGYTSRITPEEKDYYLEKGYLLTEKIGRTGLEENYQTLLRGKLGKRRIEIDSLGREQKVVAQEEPQAGHNLILNIDSDLQQQIVNVLSEFIPKQSGAVVALDPTNGKVRALVSWPLYDHNAFSQGIPVADYQKVIFNPLKPLFNRAISGVYPSGSTIKLILAAAGLNEKLITKSSQILSVGGVWYDQWFFPDWKAGGHGYTNVIKALAESVNTYFYYLALEEFEGHRGLGLEKMLNYFKLFGLGKVTGIDLANENPGFLPTPAWKKEVKGEIWYPGDTLHLAIGQGDILVTPLQVANFTSLVANQGILYQPSLVDSIIDSQNGQVTFVKPQLLAKDLIPPELLEVVQEGMRLAVTSGSAKGINGLTIALAGKTGTAQVAEGKQPHAWFTSFGPYQEPKLVLTVLVENGGEGSAIALPIAREIWQWYAAKRL